MKQELTEDQRILHGIWDRLVSFDSNTRRAAFEEAVRLPLALVPRPDSLAIPISQLLWKSLWFGLFFIVNSNLSMYLYRRFHLPDWGYLVFAWPSLLWLATLYFRIITMFTTAYHLPRRLQNLANATDLGPLIMLATYVSPATKDSVLRRIDILIGQQIGAGTLLLSGVECQRLTMHLCFRPDDTTLQPIRMAYLRAIAICGDQGCDNFLSQVKKRFAGKSPEIEAEITRVLALVRQRRES